jgi:hypothetical protein
VDKVGIQNGATIDEVVGAIHVARYMKQATVKDTIANSLRIIEGDSK